MAQRLSGRAQLLIGLAAMAATITVIHPARGASAPADQPPATASPSAPAPPAIPQDSRRVV